VPQRRSNEYLSAAIQHVAGLAKRVTEVYEEVLRFDTASAALSLSNRRRTVVRRWHSLSPHVPSASPSGKRLAGDNAYIDEESCLESAIQVWRRARSARRR
jgi:hypothetical protein